MPRRILQGTVVSDKGDKTVVVRVERQFLHPLLKKTIRRNKKYHAHDEANAHSVGDVVRIMECPPRSKLKTWEVVGAEQIAAVKAASAKAHNQAEASADVQGDTPPAKDEAAAADA